MKAPSEFHRLCQFFHQDVLRLFPSLEVAAVESVMSLTKAERPIVRDFLESVLAGNQGEEEVAELWRQSPAQIGFSELRVVRYLLELVRDALDAQLARDARSSEK